MESMLMMWITEISSLMYAAVWIMQISLIRWIDLNCTKINFDLTMSENGQNFELNNTHRPVTTLTKPKQNVNRNFIVNWDEDESYVKQIYTELQPI